MFRSATIFSPDDFSAEDIHQYTWKGMGVRTSPSAYDYLGFAKSDLKDGRLARHLVNALGNTKRALHLRMEDLCLGFGSVNLSQLGNFYALAEYIRRCGIVAPRVLDRLNKLRNAIEHKYHFPAESDVETFLDVSELFLVATDRWVNRQPVEIEFSRTNKDRSGKYVLDSLSFDWSIGEANLVWMPIGTTSILYKEKHTYITGSDEFFLCIQFTLLNDY